MTQAASVTLADPSLWRTQCLIGGEWCDADGAQAFAVLDPSSGKQIAEVASAQGAETDRAIAAATSSFAEWRKVSPGERANALRNWAQQVQDNREDLAQILVAEQGKPIAEARGEIDYAREFIVWFAEEARRTYGDVIPSEPGRKVIVQKDPVGVVAAITPWNFPAAMVTRKAAAAIAAGCTVVLKPSELTPLTALAFADLAQRAGIPAGVLNVVTGMPVEIGARLTSDPRVRKLTFTGSTKVGKLLAEQCAPTLKRLSLELGGNAPFIVFDDADLDVAVDALMQSKFRNTGQTCVCANRVFVQSGIYDAFLAKLIETTAQLKTGPGFEEGNTQGPLVSAEARAKVERLVNDAVSAGAHKVHEQAPPANAEGGYYYPPTILTEADKSMAIASEEIFGPVAVLYRFESEDEVIDAANAAATGLSAYVATQSAGRMFKLADALECGMVGVNTGRISDPVSPFGGVKESGYGREGSKYGIEEYLDVKTVVLGAI